MSIRSWLEKNEVFFQVIPPIIIAIAVTIISIQANKIALYQTRLMKSVQAPILDINCSLSGHSPQDTYTHEKWIVSNIGTPVRTFGCSDMLFLHITEWEEAGLRTTRIVIRKYFERIDMHNVTGELAILKSPAHVSEGNLGRLEQATREFINLAEEKTGSDVSCVLNRYVHATYRDIIGEWSEEVYLVLVDIDKEKSSCDYYDVSEGEGKGLFWDRVKMHQQGHSLELSELSPEKLYEKWLAIRRVGK